MQKDAWRSRVSAISFLTLLLTAWPPPAALATDLAQAQLVVAGTRLTVTPESQTVPFDTPTLIETHLEGFDPALGVLPPSLRVRADFTGPEIEGVLLLETVPGEPFRIPRLSLQGQYQLDNIRLVEGDDLLAFGEPRSAGVLVTQVLVTRVSSRPLTLDEIRTWGVVLDDESFEAFNFTFGFAVDGEVFDYNLPVLFQPLGSGKEVRFLTDQARLDGGSTGTTSPRFRPPQLAPFALELEPQAGGGEAITGGCLKVDGCVQGAAVSLPGVILFPTDVTLLHQFFSVVVMAKNDAPAGDPLTIRDLTAKVVLPPGLRQAQTEPPTPLGVPVPVRVPGPDGRLGTGDDLTFLVAQASGEAEVVVEGRSEGTHIVELQLEGLLDGLPGGQLRRLTGTARGAVVVRDPTLGITITHPDVVRTDEEYSLLLTVSNTSNAPINLVTLSLPAAGLSGVVAVAETSKTLPSLLPGESELVEFRLRSLRTGQVVASSARSTAAVTPTFELSVGVGENGIPLSPTSIILPRSTETLPPDLVRNSLALVGLGFSLATAPASLANPDLPRLDLEQVDEKVYWLGQAGRHVRLGEALFDSAAVLAAEWSGARDADWEWDTLRRTTDKGGWLGDSLAQIFAQEVSPRAAFDRFASTTAFLGSLQGALASGAGASLEVASRTSAKAVAGGGLDPTRLRDLPFADLYDLGGGQMALMAVPEDAGYQVRLRDGDGGLTELHLLVPEASGQLRMVRWSGISLTASGLAVVDFRTADTSFTLQIDSDGDGLVDSSPLGTVEILAPRPFTAVAAMQNEVDPSGHMVEVLLTQDVDLASLLPLDPQRFVIPGKVSNGGLIPVEEDLANLFETVAANPFKGLRNTRIVRVIFNNPISPYVANDLTLRDLRSVGGTTLSGVTLPVQTTVADPGMLVQGTVYGPDGQPVPFARVDLHEVDFFVHYPTPCRRHPTAAVQADAAGHFLFDYVRQTQCSDVFSLTATDPVSGQHGTARSRVRLIGSTASLDLRMLGRGTVRGRLTYDDGSVPADPRLIAYSPVFFDGREARIDTQGYYEVGDIPVGTVSVAATDRAGSFVFQTLEIPTAGAVVERDLVILRHAPDTSTGDVRGTVTEVDGTTPVFNTYLALYVDGELIGVERSALDGSFDFGTVPTGVAEVEAFDGETGLRGAQVFFEVLADQVNDVTVLLKNERGTVEGTVRRQSATGTTAVAGAVVWVSGTPFNTVTDATGFYRLEGVFAGNRTVVAADLARQEEVSGLVTVAADGSTVLRDLTFVESGPTGGLAGEVVGFSGNPVPGAVVHLSTGGDLWFGEAVTDSVGRFLFPDLAPGTYEVHASKGTAGGKAKATLRFLGETPFVRIPFEKGTIRGTVQALDALGQPFGVQSLVTYRTTVVQEGLVTLDWIEHTLQTAPDGTFEIPDVLTGAYLLTLSNAFHGEKVIRGELTFHGEVADHQVLFERNGVIRGTVLDWDGQTPMAGVKVKLGHPNFALFDLITDAQGRFDFGLVPPHGDRFPIDTEIDDGVVFRQARVWVRYAKFNQELEVEIVLPAQGSVSGGVEDSNGTPVPGAVVTLREHAYPRRTLIVNADGDGRFAFTNIFAGKVALAARAPSLGGLGSTAQVELTTEGEEISTTLTLEDTGEIQGQVTNPIDGQPVPGVQVTLYRWGFGIFDSVTADAVGRYDFRLLPLGQYRVWVFDPTTGRHGALDGVWVEFNNHVRQADLILEARGEVDGHLTEPGSGLGVPAATIRLTSNALVPLTTFSSTDGSGFFELLGIPEGSFTLRTREPEGRRQASGSGAITTENQRVTVDLVLEATGQVTGTLLNPPGAPVGAFANGNVILRQDGQVIGATLANPYTFDGVIAARPFELYAAEMGGDHQGSVTGTLPAGGGQMTLDLQMRPLGSVAVTVVDGSGLPVSGASVEVENRGFYTRGAFASVVSTFGSTAADGRAVFSGVGEGSLDVTAHHPFNPLKGTVEGSLTLDGQVVELLVQLQDSGTVRGRALLADGITPAAGALVVLTRGGRTLRSFVDPAGDFAFEGVPLGGFSVFLQESFGPGTMHRFGSLDVNGQVVDLGTLVLDEDDPRITGVEPLPGTLNFPRTSVVTLHFSEPIDSSRYVFGWFTFQDLSGLSVPFTVSWADGGLTAFLVPSSLLANFRTYRVSVNDAIDLAGRHLYEPAQAVFTSEDILPPVVIEVSPAAGAEQVPVGSTIRLVFSEPIDPASVSGAALQLTDLTTAQGLTTTFQVLPGEREVIVTPLVPLATSHQIELRVQGVVDGSGNPMAAAFLTSFWTVDITPPVIVSVMPAAGSSHRSGDPVAVSVQATDDRGVASVETRLGLDVATTTAAPHDSTLIAPFVATAADLPLSVLVTDRFGNTASTEVLLHIVPRLNAVAPTTAVGCGRNGGAAVPGVELALDLTLSDDEAVESWSLALDGVEQVRRDLVDLPTTSETHLWTVPAAALPGQVFTFHLEVRDFAGNLATQDLVLTVPAGTVLTGGGTLSAAQAVGDVILAGGVYTAAEPLTPGSLLLARGAELTAAAGTPDLDLTASGDLTVQCGAAIRPLPGGVLKITAGGTLRIEDQGLLDARGTGYPGGDSAHPDGWAPAGVAGATGWAGGGSHGGPGLGGAGEVYDSVTSPSLGGGGGAKGSLITHLGAGGGGVIDLDAGALYVDGSILASGRESCGGGSSAGGTVSVTSGLLGGAGRIDASGAEGDCSFNFVYAGGGGRVVVETGSLEGFDPATQVRATGGYRPQSAGYAGAGTLVVKLPQHLVGELILDQAAAAGSSVVATPLPTIGLGVVGLAEPDATNPADLWIEPADPTEIHSLGVVGMWLRVGGSDYRVLAEGSDRRRLLLEGAAGSVQVGDAYDGVYKFDRVTVTGGAGLVLADLGELGELQVDPGSSYLPADRLPPALTVTDPPANSLFVSGDPITVRATASDASGVTSVRFQLGDQSFVDTAAPYEWTVAAPAVVAATPMTLEVEATDTPGNVASSSHPIQVQPVGGSGAPTVAFLCPTVDPMLTPGTGLAVTVAADHANGIERVELYLGTDPVPVATDFAAPWELAFTVPSGAVDGDLLELRARARSFAATSADAVLTVMVVEGAVITADTTLAAGDLSLDGGSVVVAGGTLTVAGAHTFRDLVVLDGATVTQPASTASAIQRLELTLTRDLSVACGGVVDVTAKGYPGGYSYPATASGSSTHFAADFSTADLSVWQIVDEGGLQGPSQWSVDIAGGLLRQASNISGTEAVKPGTYAVWGAGYGLSDYRARVRLRSTDDDSIGLMFRVRDNANYYRFRWQLEAASRRLEKVENGLVTVLGEEPVAYTMSRWYQLDVRLDGPRLEVAIDGAPVFSVVDPTHESGTIALYSFANQGSEFDDVLVVDASTATAAGGSHGGRGGSFAGGGSLYGSLFDPAEPGAAGGGWNGAPGGGVVRIAAAGRVVVEGAVLARGDATDIGAPLGAGGSIRLDGATISGAGTIDASGGGGVAGRAAGGGGRIALHGGTVDPALVARTLAAGGDADSAELRGSAGTVYLRQDAEPLGELILDNGDRDSAQITEILWAGAGIIDQVAADGFTDLEADLHHSVAGAEVALKGDLTTLWKILSHPHRGQTLTLDVTSQPLTALAGDTWEGLYRFDRLIVRGLAHGVTRSRVLPVAPAEVETGASWVAEHQPALSFVEPLPGAQVEAGLIFPATVAANDLLGVGEVWLELDGRRLLGAAPPYSFTPIPPPVTVPTTYTLTATTVDRAGHALSVSRGIEVLPSTDLQAPAVSFGPVPAEGDRVLAGQPLDFEFTAGDDRRVYATTVRVDGGVLEAVSGLTEPLVVSSFTWTPPAGALPGSIFTLRVEAEDYAGNLGVAERKVQIPEGTVLSGGGPLGTGLSGQIVTLTAGTWTAVQPLDLAGLHLLDGARVEPLAGGAVDLTVSGELRIQTGAAIDATGLGFAGGDGVHPAGFAPAAVTASGTDAGGSHGGAGVVGNWTGPAGEIYDSVVFPSLPGGGGSYESGPGGAGGGAVRLQAASLVLHGEILARGGETCSGAAGAGGAVWITAASLSGGGRIDATGGDELPTATHPNCSNLVGVGGGGRVALDVDDLSGFDGTTQVSTWGGQRDEANATPFAAPGTVFTRTAADLYGRLRVDHGGRGGVVAETLLPTIGKGVVGTATVDSGDPTALWIEPQDVGEVHSLGVEGMWLRIAGTDYRVVGEAADRRGLLLEGAAGLVQVGDPYVGFYKLDALEVAGGAALRLTDGHEAAAVVVEPGSTFTSFDLTPPTVTITSPPEGAVFSSGVSVLATADASDDRGTVSSVRFQLGAQSFVDTAPPWEWTVPAPAVSVAQPFVLEVEAADPEDNRTLATRTLQVQPLTPGSVPTVSLRCPTVPGARLAAGTGLDLHAAAVSDDGIERVELLLGTDPTVLATDFTAPYQLHLDAPVGAVAGDVLAVTLRAHSFTGVSGETTVSIPVVAGQVLSADTFLASGDLSLEGGNVVVAGGTLSVEGPHSFADLVVLDGAAVSHPASTGASPERLELSLTGDLFVACGGSIDATGKGYPGGFGDPETDRDSPVHFSADFSTPDLAAWQIVDEGEANGTSNWFVDTAGGFLNQTGNIASFDPTRPGTYATWRFGYSLTDYRVSLRLRSTDDDLIGLMFRVQDSANYYRFTWQRQGSARRLEKLVGGVLTTLAEDAVPYVMNQWYRLDVRAVGPLLEVAIDGVPIFSVVDPALSTGTLALYCFGNAGSHFDDVVVAERSATFTAAGSHGGRGGEFDGSSLVYGSLFDPADPGAGGGSSAGAPGGGVVRITAAGSAVIDGAVRAAGGTSTGSTPFGAGGSIRLDVSTLAGAGVIDASGGGDGSSRPAGGGGRVALYGASLEAGLLDRTRADGGSAATAAGRGSAGTVFSRLDAQAHGDLILDNHDPDHGGIGSDLWTEILAAGSGVIDAVGANSLTDLEADFRHSLFGSEVAIGGDQSVSWKVLSHDRHGQTLVLDVSGQPWTGLAGDSYEGLYRFDRVVVRGGAQGLTRSPVLSGQPPEVAPGSGWWGGYQPTVTLTPAAGSQVMSEDPLSLTAGVDDLLGVREVRFDFDGQNFTDTTPPFEWTTTVPVVSVTTPTTVSATAFEHSGHQVVASHDLQVVRRPFLPRPDALSVGKNQDLVLDSAVLLANDDSTGGLTGYGTPDVGEILEVTGVGTVYRPLAGYVGLAVFTYTAYDVFDPVVTATAAVTVTVVGQDLHPVAQPDAAAVLMDTVLNVDVLANDFDPDGGSLQVVAVTPGVAGSAVSFDPAGTVTYTPALGYVGKDTLVTTVADVNGSQAGAELRIEVSATPPDPVAAILLEDDFADGDSVGWSIVDTGTNEAPSAWSAASGEMVQSSNIWGAGGTYAVYQDGFAWTDTHLALNLRSTDNDTFGVAVRYQANGDHYLVSLNSQSSLRRVIRVAGGVGTVLAEDNVPYRVGDTYLLEVSAAGPNLEVRLDGQALFQVTDATFAAGTVALEADANAGSIFDNVRVTEHLGLPAPPVLLADDFADGDFAGWSIADSGTGGPSLWSVVSGELIQTSNITATYAVCDSGFAWGDLEVSLTLSSTDDDTLGVAFRYQDPDNHYAFLINQQSGFRRLIKRTAGVEVLLAGVSAGYTLEDTYYLQITARGSELEVRLDGQLILTATDPDLATGTVALESAANAGSEFDNVLVTDLP